METLDIIFKISVIAADVILIYWICNSNKEHREEK